MIDHLLPCANAQFDKTIPEGLNKKYNALLVQLEEIFKEEEEHCSIKNTIIRLSADDTHNLTYFSSKECLDSTETVGNMLLYIAKYCKYFSYTILETFVKESRCEKAKKLMEKYTKEIENTEISDLELQSGYGYGQSGEFKYKDNTIRIECDRDKLRIGEINLIIHTLESCLKLPSGSVSMVDILRNPITLLCRVRQEIKNYLSELKYIAHELMPLFAFQIRSFMIDEELEMKIPLNCNTEVIIESIEINM